MKKLPVGLDVFETARKKRCAVSVLEAATRVITMIHRFQMKSYTTRGSAMRSAAPAPKKLRSEVRFCSEGALLELPLLYTATVLFTVSTMFDGPTATSTSGGAQLQFAPVPAELAKFVPF